MKTKKITTLMVALAFIATSPTFAQSNGLKESRIERIEQELSGLRAEISDLEKAKNSGVVFSQSLGKHLVILTGATALSLIKVGRAMQKTGTLQKGAVLEAVGQSTAAVAIGEGVIVGIDMITLSSAISAKKAQMNLLQDQLEALKEAN